MLENRLKELRTSKKMTQDDMANLLNIKRKSLKKFKFVLIYKKSSKISVKA